MTRSRVQKDSPTTLDGGIKPLRMIQNRLKSQLHSGPDLRQYPRQTSYIIARYTVLEGTFRDIIKNIGAGGLSVRTGRYIAVGQPVTIEFPLWQFDYLVEISGQVVRQDSKGFAVAFDEPIHGLICRDGLLPEIVHETQRRE